MTVSVEAPLKPLPAPVAPFIATPTAMIAAPQSGLRMLQTAVPAPDAKPDQLLTLGRKIFDAQNAQIASSEADAAAPTTVLTSHIALAPIAPAASHAVAEIPALRVEVAAGSSMPGPGLLLALALVVTALMSLATRRVAPKLPAPPPLSDAPTDFESLKNQTAELGRALAEATRDARKPEQVHAALDAAWYRLRFAGGASRLENGAWVQTPIATEIFSAVNLPEILRNLRPANPRYFEKIGDLLRALPLEAERAKDPDDLLKRLAWWKAHFAQFPG